MLPLLSDGGSGIDVVEIEPEFFWFETGDPREPMRLDTGILQQLAQLPQHKLVHGVAAPIGGTLGPQACQLQLMRDVVETLRAPWASEHLSFNAIPSGESRMDSGFLLPPLQTAEGATQAARNIVAMRQQLQLPVAVENNVNYLRPLPGELSDGDFITQVVQAADCGLLLDLHNLWVNEKNGRQPAREVLAQLPLDRVWEVHLAGGSQHRGYWLDAHSGLVNDEVMALAAETVPDLPNLRAIIFEMLPDYLPQVGLDQVRLQIERLHRLWALRRPRVSSPRAPSIEASQYNDATRAVPTPAAWEQALGTLVSGRPSGLNANAPFPADEPGVAILRELARNARAGQIASAAKLTTRLLLAHGGEAAFNAAFDPYVARHAPRQFASSEALAFLDDIQGTALSIPHLLEVARFESAVIRSALSRDERMTLFETDPLPLLAALAEGRPPARAYDAIPHRVTLRNGAVTRMQRVALRNGARDKSHA
ncbi:DUF692 domain-containing protein [Thermomonas sp. HDW16]|nr:DUF692 domain-containing protein [Thermomonas sp. HDW16]